MNSMKRYIMFVAAIVIAMAMVAQDADPVLLRINGKEIKRSEFEYAMNKNSATMGEEETSLEEYLEMYINFKLKVAEAEAMKLDTLESFIAEYKSNRQQGAESYLIDNDFIEREAYNIYAKDSATIGVDGFIRVAHIFKPVQQQATEQAEAEAAAAINLAYEKLQNGATLVEAAAAAGVKPNVLQPFEIVKGQAYKEFETAAFALADSAYSQPLRSPAGYHIIMKYGSRPFGQYAEYREAIIKMLEQRGIRNAARKARGMQLAKEMGGSITPEQALAIEDSLLESKYPEFGNLMTEYHDGLLFFEVCTREVWDKAAKDEKALAKFFKKNKKNYKYDSPRFRGAVVYANKQSDIDSAKILFAGVHTDEYRNIMKEHFYVDSTYTIRLEMGIFTIGSNGWVDKMVFGQGDGGKMKRGFELVDVVGKVIEKPESYQDVRGLVVNDYQKYLEDKWIKKLRRKYKVEIDKEVLKTVNNHN